MPAGLLLRTVSVCLIATGAPRDPSGFKTKAIGPLAGSTSKPIDVPAATCSCGTPSTLTGPATNGSGPKSRGQGRARSIGSSVRAIRTGIDVSRLSMRVPV